MFRNVNASMVWRAGAAAMLAVAVDVAVLQAEETVDSANPRVRELVEAGQGALLPLGDVLRTAPAVAGEVGSDQDSGSSGTPEEVDSVAEAAGETEGESATPNMTSEELEEMGSTAAEATEQWPPPPDDVEAAGLVGDSAVDEILETDTSGDGDDGELAPEVVETVTVVEEMVAVEPSAGSPEPLEVDGSDAEIAAADELAVGTEMSDVGSASEVGGVSTAMLTEEPAAEIPAAAASTVEDAPADETSVDEATFGAASVDETIVEEAADGETAVEALTVEETVVEEEVVEEPAAPEAETLDAGPVPLKTAELGNPQSIGPYRLWLASYRTVRQAKDGWQQLALANPDYLADLTPIIVLKDLGGDEGTFFRLQAGPLQTQASAVGRCEALQAEGFYCSVLGP